MLVHESSVFVHIPKTGGTSIKEWLKQCGYERGHIHVLYHAPMSDLVEIFPAEDYNYWTVIRNPYERVLSLWNQITEYMDVGTFSEWVQAGRGHHRIYGGTESYYVDDRAVRVKFEDLDKLHELPFTPDTPLNSRIHIGKYPNGRKYQDYYDTKSYDIVSKVFAEDIERHGYSFE